MKKFWKWILLSIILNIPTSTLSANDAMEIKELTADEKETIIYLLNEDRNRYAKEIRYTNMIKVAWNDTLEFCKTKYICKNIEEIMYTNVIFKNLSVENTLQDLLNKSGPVSSIQLISRPFYLPRLIQIGCSKIEFKGISNLSCTEILIWADGKKRGKNEKNFGDLCSNCKFWINRTCNAIAYDSLCEMSGPRGDKGDKGKKGDIGKKANISYNNSYGYTGQKGDRGDKGDLGDKGNPTKSKNIGAEGNKGIKGIQGISPENGIQGEKGDRGDKGEKGLTGLKGEKGQKGPLGKIIPLKGKIYYKDPTFWMIYIALWIGLIKNAIIFIIRQRKKQGNYFPILTEIDDHTNNIFLENNQIESYTEIENQQPETGIFGHKS